MKYLGLFAISWMMTVNLFAQSSQLSQVVSLEFKEIPLGTALATISDNYGIYFSYSSDFMPVNQRVSVKVTEKPLYTALDILLSKTKIIYVPIGEQIVLRVDENKELFSQQNAQKIQPTLIKNETQEPEFERLSDEELTISLMKKIAIDEVESKEGEEKMFPFDSHLLRQEKIKLKWQSQLTPLGIKKPAQFSIIPSLSTNRKNNFRTTNNVSVNVFVGATGGVSGVEIGGLLNSVKNDVKGFQVAGLGNNVGKNVTGTQVGGIFNANKGSITGVQAAGLFNFSRQGEAFQGAGLMNIVPGEFDGLQASGLFNVAGKRSDAFQAAGLFNVNAGESKMQIGAVFNVAKEVKVGQVSGLINVAESVDGFQIGFINISDTVSGVPIGLINIVKYGYNKFELYSSEMLFFNLSFKLGVKKFYNIFHFGTRLPRFNNFSWGLGYGIGTVLDITSKTYANIEAQVIHLNEKEIWTNELNTIAQLKILHHRRLGKGAGFFWGPTFNLMLSQRLNPDTGEYGSGLVPYSIFESNFKDGTSLKAWVGLNVGFRF
jgi:hypothetical protein